MPKPNDPTAVDTVVVSARDLVAALETSCRSPDIDAALRVTPPYSSRMRARLHAPQSGSDSCETTVCIPADALVGEDCPRPPEPDDVEDELRAAPDVSYTMDRHEDRYRTAIRQWRATVPDHVVEEVGVPATGGAVTVSILGTVREE
jgi:hypothetical protein